MPNWRGRRRSSAKWSCWKCLTSSLTARFTTPCSAMSERPADITCIRKQSVHDTRAYSMSWIDPYRSKLMSPREAVRCVESGMRVYIHPGCAEPEALLEALMGRDGHG